MVVFALAMMLDIESALPISVVTTEELETQHVRRFEGILDTVPGVVRGTPAPTLNDRTPIVLRGRVDWNIDVIKGTLPDLSEVEAVGLMGAIQHLQRSYSEPIQIYIPLPSLGFNQFQDYSFGCTKQNIRFDGKTIGVGYLPDRAPLSESPIRTYGTPGSGPGRLFDGFTPTFGGITTMEPGGEALWRGLPYGLKYDIKGEGLNSVTATITNLRGTPVTGRFLPGYSLMPSNPQFQKMITSREVEFALQPDETKTIRLPGFCSEIAKEQPNPSVTYTPSMSGQWEPNLAWVTNMGLLGGPWDQGRQWIGGGATFGQINDRLQIDLTPDIYAKEWQNALKYAGFDLSTRLISENPEILAGALGNSGLPMKWDFEIPAGFSEALSGLSSKRNGAELLERAQFNLSLSFDPEIAKYGGSWNKYSTHTDLRIEAGGSSLSSSLYGLSRQLKMGAMLGEAVSMRNSCPPPAEFQSSLPVDPFSVSFENLPEPVMAPSSATFGVSASGEALDSGVYVRQPFSAWAKMGGFGSSLNYDIKAEGTGIYQFGAWAYSVDGQMSHSAMTVLACPAMLSYMALNPDSSAAELYGEARAAGNAARTAEREKNDALRTATRARRDAAGLWSAWSEMVCIDRCLDGLRSQYETPVREAAERSAQLAGGAPAGVDIDQAAADARKAADDCMKALAAMKAELAQVNGRIDTLKGQQDNLMNQLDGIYKDAGAVGSHGYHADGRYHFGYVLPDKSLPQAQEQQVSQIRNQLRRLNRQYRDALAQKRKLEADIQAKEAECAALEAAAKAAEAAKANKDEMAANQVVLDGAWSDISGRLGKFGSANNSQAKGFAGRANSLINRRPKTAAEWEQWWNDFDQLIADKKQAEAAAKSQAEAKDREAQDAEAAAAAAAAAQAEATRLQEQKAQAAQAAAQTERDEAKRREQAACMEAFARWVKGYEDKMTEDSLAELEAVSKVLEAGGEIGKGFAEGLTKGLGGGGTGGMSSLAGGFVQAGAGLFYWYAQMRIAAAVEKLGTKYQLDQTLALTQDMPGKWGSFQGGVTAAGTRSFFYFREGNKVMIFRGGEDGVHLVGIGTR